MRQGRASRCALGRAHPPQGFQNPFPRSLLRVGVVWNKQTRGVKKPADGFADVYHRRLIKVRPSGVYDFVNDRVDEVRHVLPAAKVNRPRFVVADAVGVASQIGVPRDFPSLVAYVNGFTASPHVPLHLAARLAAASAMNRRLMMLGSSTPLAMWALPPQACWKTRSPAVSCWWIAGATHRGLRDGIA